MKFAIIVFPGSAGETDCYHVLNNVLGQDVEYVWYKEEALDKYDAVILPGGATYGDYLRPGALAKFAPVMKALAEFADRGGLVLGIGNGFQILTEAGLLPGNLLMNETTKFLCDTKELKVARDDTAFTNCFKTDDLIKLPIAHGYGRYFCDEALLQELTDNGQIVFTYANPAESGAIAGIINKKGNILGMMPYPERYSEEILGGTDGLKVFNSIIAWLEEVKA